MIQIIITSVCASLFFTTIHNLHIKWKVNFKPFSCGSCLASWIGVILYFSPELIVNIASVLFISGYFAAISETLMYKIWN
ncbi:hypothetical protein UFOVP19_36 [uncultured Caudovirales phage]|uniref:Uncharacterized protein n=1 Tax=uncultured Caudovirales phage TaxID=2100421 RepID=A0A6J5KMD9_9CAUD|nr:hypothetical protein UFOVP19_36 [uncultured Caudovirales phage]